MKHPADERARIAGDMIVRKGQAQFVVVTQLRRHHVFLMVLKIADINVKEPA